MSDAAAFPELIRFARKAFLEESGIALIKKYRGIDPLFTEDGFRNYATDLLNRMLNPHLKDQVERVIRDPARKLAWNDRLIGTMRLALAQGIQPLCFAEAAAAASAYLDPRTPPRELLSRLWADESDVVVKPELLQLIENASQPGNKERNFMAAGERG